MEDHGKVQSAMVVGSVVSESDLRLFSELANPTKVNIERFRQDRSQILTSGLPSRLVRSEDGQISDEEDRIQEVENASSTASEPPPVEPERPESVVERPPSEADCRSSASDNAADERSENESVASQPPLHSYPPGQREDGIASTVAPTMHFATERVHPSSPRSSREGSLSGLEAEPAHRPSERGRNSPFQRHMRARVRAPPQEPSRAAVGGSAATFAGVDPSELESLEKQSVLLDLERLKLQGISLSKEWSMHDRLDDMQFEVRRHLLHLDEQNTVTMMRDGMRLACTGLEMVSQRFAILDLSGWSNEVCCDMNKYDSALSRLYRKYWRRGYSNSPEMEIAMGIIGSMGMHHFRQKFSSHMMPGMASGFGGLGGTMPSFSPPRGHATSAPRSVGSESDDESAPP